MKVLHCDVAFCESIAVKNHELSNHQGPVQESLEQSDSPLDRNLENVVTESETDDR